MKPIYRVVGVGIILIADDLLVMAIAKSSAMSDGIKAIMFFILFVASILGGIYLFKIIAKLPATRA